MPVVDSSVLLAVLLRETASAAAAAALAETPEDLHAPDILHLEVANALVNAVRQRRLTAARAAPLIQQAASFPVMLVPTAPLVPRAWELSIRHARRPYDGVFIALAEERDEVLLTLDRTLARGLAGTSLERFVRVVD